jgi:hypothetical protein
MIDNSLKSLSDYSRFVAELLSQPNVLSSTVFVWSDSPYTSVAEGEVFFTNGLRLRMREEVDLDVGLIISYGYEVFGVKSDCIGMMIFHIRMTRSWLRPSLITNMFRRTSSTIAFLPNLSFGRPNLPFLIQEIEEVGKA